MYAQKGMVKNTMKCLLTFQNISLTSNRRIKFIEGLISSLGDTILS